MKPLKYFSLFLIVMLVFSKPALANPVFTDSEKAAIQELNQISERSAIQKLNQKSERAAIQELNQIIVVNERDEQDIQRRPQAQANANKRGSKEKPYALLDDDNDDDKNTLDPEIFGNDPQHIQKDLSPDPQNPEIFKLDEDPNNILPTEGRDVLEELEKI